MITDNLTAEEHEVVRDVRSALENGGTLPKSNLWTLLDIIERLGFKVSEMRKALLRKPQDIKQLKKTISAQDRDRRMLEFENRNMSNRIADLENTNSILTASIEESENKNAQAASLRTKIANLEADNAALRHELEMARGGDYQIEVIGGVEVPKPSWRRIEELENIVIAAQDKNRDLARKCRCRLRKIKELEYKNSELRGENSSLRKQIMKLFFLMGAAVSPDDTCEDEYIAE
jgi:chromosome segregation ATPase